MEFLGGITLLLVLVLVIIFMDKIIDFFVNVIFMTQHFFSTPNEEPNQESKNDSDGSLGNVNDSV